MKQLPNWMYTQIISDDSAQAVWCYCGAAAITYSNGLQFVCDGGHFGVPMKHLKPRPEAQEYLEEQSKKARELERRKSESRKPCKGFNVIGDYPQEGFCVCGFHESEHKQRKAA